MKTSTKVIIGIFGTLSVLGIGTILFRNPEPASATDGNTPTATASATAEPSGQGDLFPGAPTTWKLVLDESLLRVQSSGNCVMDAHDNKEWTFLDYVPIGTVLQVNKGECAGFYAVVFRMWVSSTSDASELVDLYDLGLTYATPGGYGYLLGRRI